MVQSRTTSSAVRTVSSATNFGDSPAPMFEDPPGCWLHRQGNFITGFFPEGVGSGSRLRLLLPASGESMSRWVGRSWLPATSWPCSMTGRKFGPSWSSSRHLQSASGWLETGGALAAHQTATPDMYGVDLERGIAELVAQATSFRFDASDLMPGEVGGGFVLERHDRLRERRGRSGHRPAGDRRLLAD
jgi:alpha-glucoside transport system substrate-binding protein